MTEREWHSCDDPRTMIKFVGDKTSDRKLRLLAMSCFRYELVWNAITDVHVRHAIQQAEKFADGMIQESELAEAVRGVRQAHQRPEQANESDPNLYSAEQIQVYPYSVLVGIAVGWGGGHLATTLFDLCFQIALSNCANESNEAKHKTASILAAAIVARCRHVVGNPFRPIPPLDHLPTTVIQLADALYNGKDCAFALHDALLEAGYPELADHFRQEAGHPKGCWVLDLLLGKG